MLDKIKAGVVVEEVDDGMAVPPGKRGMFTVDATGDTKLIWDPDNEVEVETARETFEKLTKKGYAAFSVKSNGKQDEKVKKFDPDIEKLILVPPMKGG